MSTIKNIELIDDVRNDALILMKSNPELTYDQAFEQARKKLIGDENIGSFEFKPFVVEVDPSIAKDDSTTEEKVEVQSDTTGDTPVKEEPSVLDEGIIKDPLESLDENIIPSEMTEEELEDSVKALEQLEGLNTDYYGNIRSQLSGIIDVTKFNDDQIEQLYIGHKMGVDITKIFNNQLTSQQIKFLCVLLATGKDITNYVLNPNFDVEEAFAESIE